MNKPDLNAYNQDMFPLFFSYDSWEDVHYRCWKNVKTGKKFMQPVKNPRIPIHIAKDRIDSYDECITDDKTNKHSVSYRWREYDIARLYKMHDFKDKVKNKQIKRKDIFLTKGLFGADLILDDRILMDYATAIADDYRVPDLNIGAWDIETDIDASPYDGQQPIYMIGYADTKHKELVIYNLRNYERYNKQKELEENIDEYAKKFIENLFKDVEDANQKPKDAGRKKILDAVLQGFTCKFVFFDDEKELIETAYQEIFYKYCPDYLYAFNTSYDVDTTCMRYEVLGGNPAKLFARSYGDIKGYYHFDTRDKSFEADRTRHSFYSSHPTKILDYRLIHYGLRRGSQFPKTSLDATAERCTGIGKLDYSHVANHISKLPLNDYIVTAEYNLRDILLILFCDAVEMDTSNVIAKRMVSCTEFERVMSPSAASANTFIYIAERKGIIYCNDVNKYLLGLDDDVVSALAKMDEETFNIIDTILSADSIKGGLVSDPNKCKVQGETLIDGVQSKKYEDVIDADAASMYPIECITGAISKSNYVYKLESKNGIAFDPDGNNFAMDVTNKASAVIAKDYIAIGHEFFGLPSAEQLMRLKGILTQATPQGIKFATIKRSEEDLTMNVDGRYTLGVIRALTKLNKTTASEQDEAGGVIRASGVFNLNNTNESIYSYNGVYNKMTVTSREGYDVNLLEMALGESYDKSLDGRNDLFFKFGKFTEVEEDETEETIEDTKGIKHLFSVPNKEKLIPKVTPTLLEENLHGRIKLSEDVADAIANSADYTIDVNGIKVQLNRRLHSIAGASDDVYVSVYKVPNTILKNGEEIGLADVKISYGVNINAKYNAEVERVFRIII